MFELEGKKILVTGANGFLGRHLVKELNDRRLDVSCGYKNEYDLADLSKADELVSRFKPDCVFHLAGYNGGISFNQAKPYDIFVMNTAMGLNVLEACRRNSVKKVLSVVASCAYPEEEYQCDSYDARRCYRTDRGIMREVDFLEGPPHDSVACHGYAKRNIQLASTYMKKQHGLTAVCVCPTTLFGPGDSFDPTRTKLVGGMVKRFVDAVRNKSPNVTCWGSGSPKRDLLYAPDCARLLVDSMCYYEDSSVPLNLGSGTELSVKGLAETVAKIVKYTGEIRWDTSKPDGQLRKFLDTTKMRELLPNVRFSPFVESLEETIKWYREKTKVVIDETVIMESKSWSRNPEITRYQFIKSAIMSGKKYRMILEEVDS